MKNPFIIAKYNVFRSISIILVSFMNRFLVAQTHRQREGGGRTSMLSTSREAVHSASAARHVKREVSSGWRCD